MDKETFDSYIKAGKIAGEALAYGKNLIVEGAGLLEVSEKIEGKILSLGGNFAFPPQISLNDVAAHYCAGSDDKTAFKAGDIVKLDIGVHVNGFVGDNALTVVIGDDEKLKLLSQASKDALSNALKIVKPGVKTSEIGRVIQDTIESFGFQPIMNLSGHGLSKFVIHDKPSIPNFEAQTNETLEEDQVIAIEPFATTGAGMIYESSNPTIFALDGMRSVRSPMTREVLGTIGEFEGLPFAERWLVRRHGLGKTRFALRDLRNFGILREYPPLPDKGHGMVSQHEHTVIVRDKPIITTLRDE